MIEYENDKKVWQIKWDFQRRWGNSSHQIRNCDWKNRKNMNDEEKQNKDKMKKEYIEFYLKSLSKNKPLK